MIATEDLARFSYDALVEAHRNRVNDRNRALALVMTLSRWIEATDVLADPVRSRALTDDEMHTIAHLEELRVYPCSVWSEHSPYERVELEKELITLSYELKGLLPEIERLIIRLDANVSAFCDQLFQEATEAACN